MKKLNICFVTGTRAEYGLLYWPMDQLRNDKKYNLQIIATGTHFSKDHGMTYEEIEKDGFEIDHKVALNLDSDSPSSISKYAGQAIIGFTDAYKKLKPDIVAILGDRYEMLSASTAALFMNRPIMHIQGGETTYGAFDEAIRHSITKMSYWHFTASEVYRKRVVQLGEDPSRVFNVGGLGVDGILKSKLLTKKELSKKLNINFKKKNLLVTYHPVTLEKESSKKRFKEVLDALEKLENTLIIFTAPNADSDSKIIKKMIDKFIYENSSSSLFFDSMGQINYLSTMKYVDAVLGNSSSGLLEAPSFKIGTINIGERQEGRLKAHSVIDCAPTSKSITNALNHLYSNEFQKKLNNAINPYGDGKATEKILSHLKDLTLPYELKKEFYDL